MTAKVSEQHESLWMTVASPLIWSVHFLLSYCTAAIWCAKLAGPDGSIAGASVAIAVYTLLALVAVGFIGFRGYQRHRLKGGSEPHDADTPEDRYRFLGFATLLLSWLSAVAIVYSALAAAIVGSC